jgi:preprotein translocase subunit SecB
MTDQSTQPEAAGGQPSIHCLAQYVKDLSFENPNAINAVHDEGGAPDVSINVQINTAKVQDNVYEVTLSIDGKAVRADKHLFLLEMHYAGLFSIENIPPEHLEPVLFIHCSTLLFPFARQIVADVTRNGGYPPLLLNPVDFNQLYMSQVAAKQPEAK